MDLSTEISYNIWYYVLDFDNISKDKSIINLYQTSSFFREFVLIKLGKHLKEIESLIKDIKMNVEEY